MILILFVMFSVDINSLFFSRRNSVRCEVELYLSSSRPRLPLWSKRPSCTWVAPRKMGISPAGDGEEHAISQ